MKSKSSEQISTDAQKNPQEELIAIIEQILQKGIEHFVPHCVVCTREVPAKRATSRMKETCGPECHKVFKAFKKNNIFRRRCPNCFHPSTPEERASYIKWRKDRGDLRAKQGRPKKDATIEVIKLFLLGFESNDQIQMGEAADLARKLVPMGLESADSRDTKEGQ